MARYALLNDDNKITNVVLADQTWIDGQTETYILDSNNEAQINGYYLNNSFIPASPFSSWTLVNNEWTPPFAKPDETGDIQWDESLQTWKRYTFTPPEGEEVGPDTPFTTETWNTTTNSFEQD
jgi:hypothetical protein